MIRTSCSHHFFIIFPIHRRAILGSGLRRGSATGRKHRPTADFGDATELRKLQAVPWDEEKMGEISKCQMSHVKDGKITDLDR